MMPSRSEPIVTRADTIHRARRALRRIEQALIVRRRRLRGSGLDEADLDVLRRALRVRLARLQLEPWRADRGDVEIVRLIATAERHLGA
jgi:hypothetical protein